jgi:hypothetical protein
MRHGEPILYIVSNVPKKFFTLFAEAGTRVPASRRRRCLGLHEYAVDDR